ncbi:MAG: 50S ribosomal protein L11 methyltransferase [Arenicella sp.]|nr:50S ribosomal protein L11 methyltransferase [Arenicella sp.]
MSHLTGLFVGPAAKFTARYLLDKPEQVRGRTVVGFGSGSGVVAIAAAKAGASRSTALDVDKNALQATKSTQG